MHNVHCAIHTVYQDALLFWALVVALGFVLGSEAASLLMDFNDNPEWRGWSMGTFRNTAEDSVGREGVEESGRA